MIPPCFRALLCFDDICLGGTWFLAFLHHTTQLFSSPTTTIITTTNESRLTIRLSRRFSITTTTHSSRQARRDGIFLPRNVGQFRHDRRRAGQVLRDIRPVVQSAYPSASKGAATKTQARHTCIDNNNNDNNITTLTRTSRYVASHSKHSSYVIFSSSGCLSDIHPAASICWKLSGCTRTVRRQAASDDCPCMNKTHVIPHLFAQHRLSLLLRLHNCIVVPVDQSVIQNETTSRRHLMLIVAMYSSRNIPGKLGSCNEQRCHRGVFGTRESPG